MMEPEYVAKYILKAIGKNKFETILPKKYNFSYDLVQPQLFIFNNILLKWNTTGLSTGKNPYFSLKNVAMKDGK